MLLGATGIKAVRKNVGEIELKRLNTVGPRYMQEIGTPKICSHIMNSHIKRPMITVN